jgi:hypothetical protein
MKHEIVLKVTTAGSAGSATGSATTETPIRGFIESWKFNFDPAVPATTDTTLSEVGGMARTLRTISNSATDVTEYPRVQATDTAGAAITGVYERFYIPGRYLSVSLAQSDAVTDALVLTINVSES